MRKLSYVDNDRWIQILKNQNISQADIQNAVSLSQKKMISLPDAIVELGVATEKDLTSYAAKLFGMKFVDMTQQMVGSELAYLLPEKLARRYTAVALPTKGDDVMLVLSNPLQIEAVEDMRVLTEKRVHPALGLRDDILKAIEVIYGRDEQEKKDSFEEFNVLQHDNAIGFEGDATEGVKEDGSEAPIVKVVDLILRDSANKGASDVHIEALEKHVRVRYRIDGNLVDALTLPKKQQGALLARLKIMSNLDITENRIPQDGRFRTRTGSREIDYRVSVMPTFWGGKVVFRALDKENLRVGLNDLGFTPSSLENFKRSIQKPFGMIIITGPTGSGKTTTLYSILSELNCVERNIITVEDPIEYQVSGITQVQAKAEIGLTFATSLKAILRQSPDVVMIGEIRDSETADIAVKASLTGQLVLSTLHTNDAASAVVRLRDMGIESFLIASSLNLVSAQRLCRKICSYCKETVQVPRQQLDSLGYDEKVASLVPKPQFSRGKGCKRCGNSGCKGRIAITETLWVDSELQEMIESNASSEEIKNYGMHQGMITLRDDALIKFAQGVIPLEEVIRVTANDETLEEEHATV